MDIEKLIEETIINLAEIADNEDRHGSDKEKDAEHVLRAAFAEVRRVAIEDAMRAQCATCRNRGVAGVAARHSDRDGWWPCTAKAIAVLLPPPAEGAAK